MIDRLSRNEKIFLAVFALFALVVIFLNSSFVTEFSAWQESPFSSSRVNILLTGYDIDHDNISRTDTIMIVSFDTSTGDFNILSVPRDTRVEISGRGMNRVNSAYAFGGIDLTIETLEDFLQIPIDYYVNIDFQGFIDIVDAMGGVELEVEERMQYVDDAGDLYIDIPQGEQLLDGEKALDFVRYRDARMGDIGRVQRQQKFISAAISQLMHPSSLTDMPEIVSTGLNAVYTDIDHFDALPFLRVVSALEFDEIETAKLPGSPEYIGGASYWIVDEEEKVEIVDEFLRGEKQRRYTDIELNIYNGSGQAGAAGDVASKLSRYGFQIGSITNADSFDYERTEVVYSGQDKEDIALRIRQYLDGDIHMRENQDDEDDSIIEITVGDDLRREN